MASRIMIFEPEHGGHRMQYVGVLLNHLRELGAEVILATNSYAQRSEEYAVHVSRHADGVQIDSSYDCFSRSLAGIAYKKAIALSKAVALHKPDRVLIPYADGLTQLFGIIKGLGLASLPSNVSVEALLMRGRFAYPPKSLKSWIFERLWTVSTRLAGFQTLHFLDPIPFEALDNSQSFSKGICRLMPEPVETMPKLSKAEARRSLGLEVDGLYFGTLGRLDERKGVDLLVRAFTEAKLTPNAKLLLFGSADASVRQAIDACVNKVAAGRIVLIDKYLSQEQFIAGIAALDVVCTPYPRHIGSSGILVRAAALGRPVLASDYGWVGMVTSRFKLGKTCPSGSADALKSAIEDICRAGADVRQADAAVRFAQFHTVRNFCAHWTVDIKRSMGIDGDDDLVSWSWVLNGPDQSPAK